MNPVASVGRSLVLLGLGVAAFGLLLSVVSSVIAMLLRRHK
jgi:hypothetical protein